MSWSRVPVKSCLFAFEMSLAAEQSGLWNFLFFTFRI